MKTTGQFVLMVPVFTLLLSGCYLTREPVWHRDDYFRPVTITPQRNNSAPISIDTDKLRTQIELATKAMTTLRDSLVAFQQFAGSLLVSTRALVDKVSELETKEFITTIKQKDLEQSVAMLQSENKQITQQLTELRARVFAGNVNPQPSVFSPVRTFSSLRNEYAEGISLFQQRQYDDALTTFSGLLDKGIEDDLADNCEYWIGECRYAQHEYHKAISAFQKVLTITSSNKKVDAYFLLGKSYEQIGDFVKARWAYEELSLLYPDNEHARVVKSRLNMLKQTHPSPKNIKQKKTTA
jgi:TolA-binding protein